MRSSAAKLCGSTSSDSCRQCACEGEHARAPHKRSPRQVGLGEKLRNGPALTLRLALVGQVWRALCKPLNQEVAVKLVNLERQDVDLVRARMGLVYGAYSPKNLCGKGHA